MECLKPHSTKLQEIGLALLKFVSSHRGLIPEIFDEYTRRQYVAKAPERNPFGTEEEPAHFKDFDVFTKIKVLQQLSIWTFNNPDRIRERMEEQKDSEQTYWRVEPFGWDSEDRTYIILDDNRLYRTTEPPPPPPSKAKPKKNSKKARAASRASKRRRVSQAAESEHEEEPEVAEEAKEEAPVEDDGLGGMKWECLAITLDEVNQVIASFAKTKDDNEKILRKRLTDDLLPLLEQQEEKRKRKMQQKERELKNLELLAHAKRSSRIASKMEHQKEEEERREAERKHQEELKMAKKEQEKWRKLEKERESRMQTREQRLREREAKRILHEEELANLSEDNKKLETGEAGRLSERHLKAEIERKKQALEQLQDDEDWVFDCICGAYGQIDDGTLSIACEKCNVWQHTKCVGVSDEDANNEDFHFICKTCIKREKDAEAEKIRREKEAEEEKNRPKLKLNLHRPDSSPSQQGQQPLPAVRDSSPTPAQNGQPQSLSPVKNRQIQSSPSRPQYDGQSNGGAPILPPIPFPQQYPGYRSQNGTAPPRPVSQGSTPAAPQYANYMNGSTPARPSFGQLHGHQSPFSSPLPHSPTSLPPPMPQPNYHSLNGHSNGNRSASTQSYNGNVGSTPAGPRSASQGSYGQAQRRPSNSFPSPLANAPYNNNYSPNVSPAQNGNSNNNAPGNYQPAMMQETPSKPPSMPSGSAQATPAPQTAQVAQTPYSNNATYQEPNAILPPMSAGISPIKQSPPPRPLTANGNISKGSFQNSFSGSFGPHGTPNHIPPVAPLSPSPQVVNLSPPVKHNPPIPQTGLSFGVQNTTLNVGDRMDIVENAPAPQTVPKAENGVVNGGTNGAAPAQ